MKKILVTGSFGQVGSELISALSSRYGGENVLATDIRIPENDHGVQTELLDVTEYSSITGIIREYSIDTIFHLAAILSALGEKIPDKTFEVNCTGTYNILRAAREEEVRQVVIPSTIGVFGPETPREAVPPITIERPSTMYGITKVGAELVSSYFRKVFDMDIRGLRFPGLISYKTLPSAGTTDYAVDMIIKAVSGKDYRCYLSGGTELPMMYMPDAIDSLVNLSEADRKNLKYTLEYNVQAFSFTPEMLEAELKKHYPDFTVTYEPDYRQSIAETWPGSLDVSDSENDWGFRPKFTFEKMVEDMIAHLQPELEHHRV